MIDQTSGNTQKSSDFQVQKKITRWRNKSQFTTTNRDCHRVSSSRLWLLSPSSHMCYECACVDWVQRCCGVRLCASVRIEFHVVVIEHDFGMKSHLRAVFSNTLIRSMIIQFSAWLLRSFQRDLLSIVDIILNVNDLNINCRLQLRNCVRIDSYLVCILGS